MTRRLLAIFVSAVGIAAIAAGCGGESTPSPTKAEFTKQASAICEKGVKDIQRGIEVLVRKRAGQNAGAFSKPLPDAAAEDVVLPNFEEQVEDLRALGSPSGDEAEVTAILTTFEKAIKEGAEEPKGIFRGGAASLGKTNQMATKYGLKYCGQP